MDLLRSSSFDKVIANHDVYVVKFYTNWCPDCIRTEKGFRELASAYGDKARFGTVDAEEAASLAQNHGVRGIPTVIVFRQGKEIKRLLSKDAKTKEQIDDFLQQVLI
ncbi:thioredoxin family protein [Heliorestis acidaminivorans]|uniref:Thioredoxin family protein n=1 Tax=Heliorestis acidaminivorans TaxID=553427 RepID=A0A6I0F3D3_9FIRM|nr:thioredoxin family protein [Heliorestis acidaminivorans]KAB2953883.1 thioredoxin family protein [Heliorestis acidaminivorans]